MLDFEFVVPEEHKKYVQYILANCRIECEYMDDNYEVLEIIPYRDGTHTYMTTCIAKERENILLSYEEGFKKLYNYYKKIKAWKE
jgi:hypothetical protein